MLLFLLRFCIVLIFSLLFTACGTQVLTQNANVLRVNIGAEPPSLDWSVCTDATSFDVVSNIMVGLTQYRNDLSCAPACASSWEILEGGSKILFHLRHDVFWSDGKPVTAYDFEYAWKRLLNPKVAAQYAFFLYDVKNAFAYNCGRIKDAAQVGIKALDPYTFEVRLVRPVAYFLDLTAFCVTYPQRQDLIEKWGNTWTDPGKLVSNGPFTLSKWQHEYKIELTANPLFFEGKPKIDKIKMFMVPEQSTAFALYENNQLDFIDNRSFSTSDVERFRQSREYRNFLLLRGSYIGFNVNKNPFQDKRVRQAFSMAIDRQIFPIILRRGEKPIGNWIPPGLLGCAKTGAMTYDPRQARKLLAAAGYAFGKNFPRLSLLYPSREDARLVVESVQDQLKRNLNVSIALVNQEWRVYLETLHLDPPPLFRGAWGADYPDPQTFMNLFMTHNGNNTTGWSNALYDQLVMEASTEQNQAKRGQLYAQADKLLCREQCPIAPLYVGTQNIMVKPWVHGIANNPLDLQFFKGVEISHAPAVKR